MTRPNPFLERAGKQQGNPIKVSQANLKTATITVKALTIDKRQVTLAVFRQLIEENIIDNDTGEFKGLPWGTINYCPDKKLCANFYYSHYHIVWQKGDELRRATVEKHVRPNYAFSDHGEAWLIAALADGWRPRDREAWKTDGHLIVTFDPELPPLGVQIDYRSNREDLAHALGEDLKYQNKEYNNDWELRYQEKETESIETGQKLIAQAIKDHSRSDWRDCVLADLHEAKEYWDRRDKRWKEIQALDQIFIAT